MNLKINKENQDKENHEAINFLNEAGAFHEFYPDDIEKIKKYMVDYLNAYKSKTESLKTLLKCQDKPKN